MTHFGASSQKKLSTRPSAAPNQTVARTIQLIAPSKASSANGV